MTVSVITRKLGQKRERVGLYIGTVKVAELYHEHDADERRVFKLDFLDERHGFRTQSEAVEFLKKRLNRPTPAETRPMLEEEEE